MNTKFQYHDNLSQTQLKQLAESEKFLSEIGKLIDHHISMGNIETVRDVLKEGERCAFRISMAIK